MTAIKAKIDTIPAFTALKKNLRLSITFLLFDVFFYPGSRKPRLRAVTPACTKRFDEVRHFGVQARLLAGISPHRGVD
jgi:hypothetical protein